MKAEFTSKRWLIFLVLPFLLQAACDKRTKEEIRQQRQEYTQSWLDKMGIKNVQNMDCLNYDCYWECIVAHNNDGKIELLNLYCEEDNKACKCKRTYCHPRFESR